MYAISNASRVYIAFVFLLCSSLFFAPKVNAIYTWQDARNDFEILKRDTNDAYRDLVKRPSNSALSTASSPATVAKNPSGGLSVSTNQILKDMGRSTNLTATSNFSLNSAKTALKSCVRSPSCAGRALGAGSIIYEGIKGWQSVYQIYLDDNDIPSRIVPMPVPPSSPDGSTCEIIGYWPYDSRYFSTCDLAFDAIQHHNCVVYQLNDCPLELRPDGTNTFGAFGTTSVRRGSMKLIAGSCPSGSTLTVDGCISTSGSFLEPIPYHELDQMIDDQYDPEPSDSPVLFAESPASSTILRDPESITLTTPAPIELPSTTTTNTFSGGQTTTSVTNNTINYNITNNNTSNPSINSELVETTTIYDSTGNVTDTTTSTTISNGVPSEVPAPSAPLDLELPAFCSWASIVCEWIGWTKEGIEGEEPDLINLISEFEPDESQYNSGIGSGSCPAPITLNLLLINETVEISYQLFCDFLDMIRPLVIAGAWLLSAFMYVGVLRRG